MYIFELLVLFLNFKNITGGKVINFSLQTPLAPIEHGKFQIVTKPLVIVTLTIGYRTIYTIRITSMTASIRNYV